MNRTAQYIIGLVLLALVILLVVWSSGEKPVDNQAPLAAYFQERMTTLGVEDIGQPIEGFDANLLIMAFPGLIPADFSNVETIEGYYMVEGDQITLVRGEGQPITSAERMVSQEGYGTLLANVSARLNMLAVTEADVNAIIEIVNTAETLETKIGQGASAFGVKVTPLEVLEDSRCPANANCVQMGRIRVRATIESAMGISTNTFEIDTAITTEGEEVTLTRVEPASQAGVRIEAGEYVFYFRIAKRPIGI